MKIEAVDTYRDGGTRGIETDVGEFCIDNRIGSFTKGSVWVGYPESSGSRRIDNVLSGHGIVRHLIEALRDSEKFQIYVKEIKAPSAEVILDPLERSIPASVELWRRSTEVVNMFWNEPDENMTIKEFREKLQKAGTGKMNNIIVYLKGGVVLSVMYPEDHEGPFVEIHDYDVDGTDSAILEKDDDGNEFVSRQF